MKKLLAVLLVGGAAVWGQVVGGFRVIVPFTQGETASVAAPEAYYAYSSTFYWYEITRAPNGDKVFSFSAYTCVAQQLTGSVLEAFVNGDYSWVDEKCVPLSVSQAAQVAPIAAEMKYFYSLKVEPPAQHRLDYHVPVILNSATRPEKPRAATAVDQGIVFLDGFTTNLLDYDFTTLTTTSTITLPDQPVLLAIRPQDTQAETQVWTFHAGFSDQLVITDLSTKSVIQTIPVPSLAPANSIPVGLGFTNDGNIALLAVAFRSADAKGNYGAVLAFDAAAGTLASTLPIKGSPSAFVMAPDGLTAYLLNVDGTITYYDILSETADLTVTTFIPGQQSGYSSGAVFAHPDGTRLFWLIGPRLAVFDLASHKMVHLFDSGLPTTSGASMQLSQDGSRANIGNGAGNNAIVDTRTGQVLGTFNTNGASQGFGGLPGQ